MFDNLTDRLSYILRNISNRGRLSEENIKETLREVRMALLEADVALPVVQEFVQSVKENAVGKNVNKSLTLGQELVKIVQNQLIRVMGDKNSSLNLAVQTPAVILMAGLQGAGKTTTVAKLGKFLKEKQKKKVLVVSADIYRPAAIKQLETLTQMAGIDFFPSTSREKPVEIAINVLQQAKSKFYDVLIIDTAGCWHIDTSMIEEIQTIHQAINPIETLFIVDAMTGQDAANIAKSFNETLPLTGVILTKIDGDARGGAVLSIRHITGKPIKFLGIGEKINCLEPFSPEKIASRILGMENILSLIKEIESNFDLKNSNNLIHKIKKENFIDLNYFLEQLKQMRNIDNITSILNKMQGIFQISNSLQIDDKLLVRMEAIINSMTIKERNNPKIIERSRKMRISAGSGIHIQEVNRLLKQFDDMLCLMNKIKKGGLANIISGMKGIIPPWFPYS
ncbi:Signal recognition particle protein [Arsenophonus endosymbiont of Aleurodicus dispersus]|uniref:signal recognition particle protein n=1 Tax=Arsenophonus endosymbiont of Aleurodicus dispersus TaxID=235559 RepID=UPI000EABDB6D|nr:signal recognition particle protein [Arsenophonus endosymbiont of Aleurodicus dispersus]VAY02364.1 Signal recognition particle protein [Arsenophonus endosymbiont of Aleurodicus dispersus]